MTLRGLTMFLIGLLYATTLPWGNTAIAKTRSKPQQDQPVMMEQPVDDGNPNTGGFSGTYSTGGQQLALDAFSVNSDPYLVQTPEGEWTEQVDYLYTDSEIRKSTVMVSPSPRTSSIGRRARTCCIFPSPV